MSADGESKTHARIGSVAAVVAIVLALGGMAVNFIEWKEAIAIARNEQLRTDRDVAAVQQALKELAKEIAAIRERKDDVPLARLEERMIAMQKQMDRIEKARRW